MAALDCDTATFVGLGYIPELCHRTLAVQNQNPANPCGQL
jgi:hypothetical protein